MLWSFLVEHEEYVKKNYESGGGSKFIVANVKSNNIFSERINFFVLPQ
jgi:hypothetical protein